MDIKYAVMPEGGALNYLKLDPIALAVWGLLELDWMKHKLESRLPGEISATSDMQMTPSSWQNLRSTKEPFDESERQE